MRLKKQILEAFYIKVSECVRRNGVLTENEYERLVDALQWRFENGNN